MGTGEALSRFLTLLKDDTASQFSKAFLFFVFFSAFLTRFLTFPVTSFFCCSFINLNMFSYYHLLNEEENALKKRGLEQNQRRNKEGGTERVLVIYPLFFIPL